MSCIVYFKLHVFNIISTFSMPCLGFNHWVATNEQESHAVARKLHNAAAVLFGLQFADNIHYKFKSSQGAKQFNAKCPFKLMRGHMFWSQWKGDKGLSILCNNIGLICSGSDDVVPATFCLRKIRSPSADPTYLADHGLLLPISDGHVIQQKIFCSINRLYGKYVKQFLKALFVIVKI